jgi:hypothetical protein
LIDESTSLADVAGAVAAALREIEHDPVVVGGSAATVHAPEAYRSDDIDMVVIGGVDDPRALTGAMESIGFHLTPGHFFGHERSRYTVDFVRSPVAIGGDVISEFATVPTQNGFLRVLHVEDVVKDRLNKYVCYTDQDAFEVAVAVARSKRISLDRVAAFVQRQAVADMAESFNAAFDRLRQRLDDRPRRLSTYGFTTAFRVEFRTEPTQDEADAVGLAIHKLLDEERAEIHPALDGVAISQSPVSGIEGVFAHMVLRVHTKRDLPPVDRFSLAERLVEHVRASLATLPKLRDVPDDGIPPVATTGL